MPDQVQFTDAQKASYRETYAPIATEAQWNLFINECQRRNLVPGVHVVFQLRDDKVWKVDLQKHVDEKKVVFITTIAALRLIAQRNGNYAGHGPFTYYYKKTDGTAGFDESKIPVGHAPHAVSVEGYRRDWQVPLFATARYDAYVQKKDEVPTFMWSASPEEMTAKCCEALMLRTVAPEECAGLLITEELGNGGIDKEASSPATQVTTVIVPQATVAPAVNQKPDAKIEEATLVIKASPEVLEKLGVKQEHVEVVQTTRMPPVPPVDPELDKLLKKALDDAEPGKTVTVGPAITTSPEPTPSSTAAKVEVVPPAVVSTTAGDAPCTAKEYGEFLNGRATKIVRDKVKLLMKESEAAGSMQKYLLKQSGKTGLKQISAATYERLLSALENATPEGAVEILRTQSK